MSSSNRLLTAVVAAMMALVVLIVVVFDDSGDSTTAKLNCANTSQTNTGGTTGSTVPQGVPAGALSKPLKTGTYKVGDGWHIPSRPDHEGVDLAADDGTPIYAMADGVVAASGPASGFGLWIVINHIIDGQRMSTVYGHMNDGQLLVNGGAVVHAGDHIANVGHNGEASGPHLHFEVWLNGNRLDAAHSDPTHQGPYTVDPQPWIERGVDPGTQTNAATAVSGPRATTPVPAPAPVGTSTPPVSLAAASQAEMASLPSDIGSEAHLQIDTIRVARAVHAKFPQITTMYGWRESDPYPDHPSGKAIDVMIPNWDTDTGRQLGDQVRDYIWAHKDLFDLNYMIWRQTYYGSDGSSNLMEDRSNKEATPDANAAANHFNHVHITTHGGGLPQPGQSYGAAPEVDVTGTTATPGNCKIGADSGVGDDNATFTEVVPERYRKWILLSAKQCKELSPALIGGQLKVESGFTEHVTSPAGARGPAQFMHDTWVGNPGSPGYGFKVDDAGNRVGDAGGGDIEAIPDAVMAQGRYDCDLAASVRKLIESGQVTGDVTTLMLVAYNGGLQLVKDAGGVPLNAESQGYAPAVKAAMKTVVVEAT
ncbi:peptidoglycan DD-metalloendopeptidase family protein [Nocardia niigatensis]